MALTRADVLVVGAGAAGLMAACCAAARGRQTLLLEKSERPGLKILISGGGRCNLTTTRTGQDLEDQYGSHRGRWLRHALRSFPPAALRELVERQGVPLHEEDLEKIFPVSRRARDVLDAFVRLATGAGTELRTGCAVTSIGRGSDGFLVHAAADVFLARSVILATGGLSYPKTGATGDGYPWLRALGHTITATWPALAPLAVDAPWIHALQGIVLHEVELAVLAPDGRVLRRRRRPILFTHRGLSGPGPMDLAGDIEELAGAARLRFDFAPDRSREQIEQEWLREVAQHGRRHVGTLLPAGLPERARTALCSLAGVDGALAALAKEARRRLLDVVKNLIVPVRRSLGYAHAEVTRGGVALDEIDGKTMQSRLVPGLFVCGELLDVDGPIGGFNFQAAFATGRLAGLHA
ncbi:MAG: NAD(P)/FAD-dependent oxidoreductase [Planctomycetes bacterium]|nr:NAD(P)/FAD-dependent oxidoreductase [Planctomycetota bacterium]